MEAGRMKRRKELLRSPEMFVVGVRDLEGLDLFYQGVEWHSPRLGGGGFGATAARATREEVCGRGEGESLHAVETVILLLLVLVAGFAAMARRLRVPYPIVLVIAGLAISFVPRMPRVPLNPNIVFVIFLPPLLYASAWAMSWREFRRNAVVVGLLAVGLVGFTVWGVAEFSDRFITALGWGAGL